MISGDDAGADSATAALTDGERSFFSIAIGVISSTTMSTLSPGITISRPSGSVATPVSRPSCGSRTAAGSH